jgi:transcriptional regulator with XRE-family HTH domain
MTFGETLRELRVAAGMTQTGLAARIGVSGVYVCRAETGVTQPPTMERVRQIADVLGVPSDRLLLAALVERGTAPMPTNSLGRRVAVMTQIYPDEAELRRALFLLLAAG